jgi:hypothetical protein
MEDNWLKSTLIYALLGSILKASIRSGNVASRFQLFAQGAKKQVTKYG